MEVLLSNFFNKVEEKDLSGANSAFDDLLELKDPQLSFLAFWYALTANRNKILQHILKKTAIECNGIQLQDDIRNILPTEMNTHAFETAEALGLSDTVKTHILKRKRIILKVDYIINLMREGNYQMIGVLWENEIECKPCSNNHLELFKEKKVQAVPKVSRRFTRKSTLISTKKIVSFPKMNEIHLSQQKITLEFLVKLAHHVFGPKSAFGDQEETRRACRAAVLSIVKMDPKRLRDSSLCSGLYSIGDSEFVLELYETGHIGYSLELMKTALQNNDYRTILALSNDKLSKICTCDQEILELVLLGICLDRNNLETHLFLIKKFASSFNEEMVRQLLVKFEAITTVNVDFVVGYCSNPIKIYVLLSEILLLVKQRFVELTYSVEKLLSKFEKEAEAIEDQINDEKILKEILLEKDLENRTVLQVIAQIDLLGLLKNKYIQKIIQEQWNGPHLLSGGFLETSSNWKALQFKCNEKDYDCFEKTRVNYWNHKESSYKMNFTHFKVWRYNITSKYTLSLILWLFFCLFFQIGTISLWYQNKILLNNKDTIDIELYNNTILPFLQTEEGKIFLETHSDAVIPNATLRDQLHHFVELHSTTHMALISIQAILNILHTIAYILLLLPLNYLFNLVAYYRKRVFSKHLDILTDSIIFCFSLTLLVMTNSSDRFTTVDTFPPEEGSTHLLKIGEKFGFFADKDRFNFPLLYFAIFTLALWVKLMRELKGTKTFGPLIVTLYLSVKRISIYICAFSCICFIFSSFGLVVFYPIKEYFNESQVNHFMYMFFLSLGGDTNFESYIAEMPSKYSHIKYFAPPFFFSFLCFTLIIFFNLIVAVLTNIYEIFRINSLQLYFKIKLQIRSEFLIEDDRFDAILMSPFPFNVFIFPILPVYCFIRDDKVLRQFNTAVLKIAYIPYLCIYTSIYFIVNILLVIPAFLKVFIAKTIQLFVKDNQQYYLIFKLQNILLYSAFGLPLQLFYAVNDTFIFTAQLFRISVRYLFEKEEATKYYVKMRLLTVILKVLKTINEESSVHLKEDRLIQIVISRISDPNFESALEFSKYNLALVPTDEFPEIEPFFDQRLELTKEEIKQLYVYQVRFTDIRNFIELFADETGVIDLFFLKSVILRRIMNYKDYLFNLQMNCNNLENAMESKRKVLEESYKQKRLLKASVWVERIKKKIQTRKFLYSDMAINEDREDSLRAEESKLKRVTTIEAKSSESEKIKLISTFSFLANGGNLTSLNEFGEISADLILFPMVPRIASNSLLRTSKAKKTENLQMMVEKVNQIFEMLSKNQLNKTISQNRLFELNRQGSSITPKQGESEEKSNANQKSDSSRNARQMPSQIPEASSETEYNNDDLLDRSGRTVGAHSSMFSDSSMTENVFKLERLERKAFNGQ